MLTQALDASTTCVALGRGAHETNPWLHDRACPAIVAIKAGMTTASVLSLRELHRRTHSKWPVFAAAGLSSLAAGAGVWNLRQLSRASH